MIDLSHKEKLMIAEALFEKAQVVRREMTNLVKHVQTWDDPDVKRLSAIGAHYEELGNKFKN